ncbi:MAG: NAD-dependent epimerase/dehydratase family protein [Chthoniobacterales bacterium]
MNMATPLAACDLDHVLQHTQNLWEPLRRGRLFLTGGTGFFGAWLVESFCHINDALGLGAEAVVLTRDPAAAGSKFPHLSGRGDLEFIKGDIRDFCFPDGDFSHVIHAATTSGAPVPPHEMLETIVGGTQRVIDFIAPRKGCRLLYISSGAVYGPQPPSLTHIPEEYPGAPDSLDVSAAYGNGKRAAEHLCAVAAMQSGFEFVAARCFAFIGPHLPLDAHFAIGNFIRDAMRGGPIRVGGDGTPFRSYLYAADLAVWLWTLLFRGVSARAYNVGSSEDMTIAAIASEVARALDIVQPVEIARDAISGRPPSRYVPSVERAGRELNLSVRIGLQESIRRTAAWHKAPQTIVPESTRG